MKSPILHYDREQDILYIMIRAGVEHHFAEVAEDVIVEFDEDNQPIAIEIFNALATLATVFGRDFPEKKSALSAQFVPEIR